MRDAQMSDLRAVVEKMETGQFHGVILIIERPPGQPDKYGFHIHAQHADPVDYFRLHWFAAQRINGIMFTQVKGGEMGS